jgi:hypothetical protein
MATPRKTTARPRPAAQSRAADLPPLAVDYFDGRRDVVQVTQRELAEFEREHGDVTEAWRATPHSVARFLAHAALEREGRTALDLDGWDRTVRTVADAEG